MRKKFIQAGISSERIHTLPHARTEWPPSSQDIEIPKVPSFLFLGRLIEEKGVNLLLEAWDQYCGEGGEGSLTIAGSGPLEASLSAAAALLQRVTLAGQVSGVRKDALLRDCTAVIVPSLWWEAFGLVVYDAYAYSKPALVAASGGLSELVEHGETGWIHDPGNIRAIVSHLKEAAADPAETARRGLRGHAKLLHSAMMVDWLDGFERIVQPLLSER